MSIYAGLKSAIENNVTGYSNKCYPLVAQEGEVLPYATYQQTYTDRLKTLQGYTGGLFVDYQVNLFNTTYIGARTAADEFITYIKNFSGTMGAENVQSVQVLNEFEDMDEVGSIIRYKVIVELRFYYIE